MDDELKSKITAQIEKILSENKIFDYNIHFVCKKVCLKLNNDITISICSKNFSKSQILNDDPKWLKCINCKINNALKICKCVWVICINDTFTFDDLNFINTSLTIKERYEPVLNGFSCYSNQTEINKLLEQNLEKILICDKDEAASTKADNLKQTVGPFIFRLGTNKSSRRAGTQKPVYPIPSVIYAFVVDTGILETHPDLKEKISTTYSINYSSANRKKWNDDNGHGTHVSGIIGAIDNTIGIVGNSPGVNLVAVKVLNQFGSGSYSNIISGINYIATWKKNNPTFKAVVNMSLGGPPFAALDNAIKNLINKFFITVCVAAGNETSNASNFSPSRVLEAITVGAYDIKNNSLANFSNFGKVVDILAPGVNIDSCYLRNGYAVLSGTSMASPMVAGAVVDIISNPKYANYTPVLIRNKLVEDAKVINPICEDGTTGSNPIIILTPNAKNTGTTDRSVYIGTY